MIPVFAHLDQETDLTIESLNFCTRSQGSVHLSDSSYSSPLADKTTTGTTSKSSAGSSSEANSPVSIKPTESEGNLTDLLDEILYKPSFKDVSDLPRQNSGLDDNIDFDNNFDSEENFIDL
jgi:hypothetical protein